MKSRASQLVQALLYCALLTPAALGAQSAALRGSHEKMLRQRGVADSSAYPLLQTGADVEQYADLGVLVLVEPSADLQLARVSFAVTRPEVRTFVRRLAHQYHEACGEPLIVTSLTRPLDEQPENASELSVHPAGMAVDMRRPTRRACRRWLEKTLVSLQDEGVLAATRESRPVHYHVAVFPQKYMAMVEAQGGAGGTSQPATVAADATALGGPRSLASADLQQQEERASAHRSRRHTRSLGSAEERARAATYRVQRGDTLGQIAARHGISVALLKRANGIRGSRIAPGQVLRIPLNS
ncbi:MAG TPA: DUF5715 family protein [Longimicrobiales bacterium]